MMVGLTISVVLAILGIVRWFARSVFMMPFTFSPKKRATKLSQYSLNSLNQASEKKRVHDEGTVSRTE